MKLQSLSLSWQGFPGAPRQRLFGHCRAPFRPTHWSRSLWGLGLAILVLLGLPLLWATPEAAAASSSAPQTNLVKPEDAVPPASAQPDASTVPSETVSRFVSAYLAVVKLIESREQSLQGAETETESRQMQQEIQAEAISLIQANDLTLQAYWELLGLANSDPEFRERVLAQIEEASP